jgi:hypothetical protein
VTERRKRLEKALRECAEQWEPQTADPWPAIRERVSGERIGENVDAEQVGDERASAGARRRRRAWPPRLVPNTPLGWGLAILSVLILGTGAYAASGPVGDLLQYGLPGPAGSGEMTNQVGADGGSEVAYSVFRSNVPGGGGEKVGQTRTADGAKVTVVWAYADAKSVVVGYTVEDPEGGRRVGEHPAELYPGGVRLTDRSGATFEVVSSGGAIGGAISPPGKIVEGPKANWAVFEVEGRIEPGSEHLFRLEIPLEEWAVTTPGQNAPPPEPVGEPFVFDFEIPVHPAPVLEVNQKDTANGITLTLERVTDSPGRPEAVICFEPPDDVRGWFPIGKDLNSEDLNWKDNGNCVETLLNAPLEGHSSVTVEQIEFNPANGGESVRGPWIFEFEVPGP